MSSGGMLLRFCFSRCASLLSSLPLGTHFFLSRLPVHLPLQDKTGKDRVYLPSRPSTSSAHQERERDRSYFDYTK